MKIPKARKLSSGKWFIQLRLNGESIPVTADTEAKCQAEAAAIKSGLKKVPNRSDTLRAALDEYIEKRKKTLSPSTLYVYNSYRNNFFQSAMDKPFSRVDWQAVIDAEEKAPKTIKSAWTFASAAMAEKGFHANVILPKVQKKEMQWLSPDEIPVFLNVIKGTSCELPALLGLHSLRRSEMFGLDWGNVDLVAGTLSVKGAVVLGEDGRPVFKDTNKTKDSARTIPIMIPRLREILTNCKQDGGPVLTGRISAPQNQINKICRDNNLPEVGLHGLRRSFASLGYSLKLSEKEIMTIGGWSDFRTVHRFYLYISENDLEEATKKMAAFYTGEHSSEKTQSASGIKISALSKWFEKAGLSDELLEDCLKYLFENANQIR